MLDAIAIARRIKSRFAKIAIGYSAGPLVNGRAAYVDLITGGRTYRAYVSPLLTDGDPRPVGFDHIVGERPKVDQLILAEIASKAIAGMARVSKDAYELAQMEPWHKAGTAGFVVRCTFGGRFLVEIYEVTPMMQIAEASAKIEMADALAGISKA